MQILRLTMRVGATEVPCAAGHASVAEPGQEDALGRLVAFARPRVEREFPLFAAFAPRGALYVAAGATALAGEPEWRVSARRIPAASPASGAFRPFDEERDLGALLAWHARANRERSASMVRTAETWPWLLRRPPEIWMREDGYVGVRRHAEALEICEASGEGEAFFDAALRHAAGLAREAGTPTLFGTLGADDPIVTASAAHGMRHRTRYPRRTGLLGTILDLPALVALLRDEWERRLARSPYARTRVALVFAPPQAAAAECAIGPADGASRHLRVALPNDRLLQAFMGYTGVDALVEDPMSGEDRRLLSTLLPTSVPLTWTGDRW